MSYQFSRGEILAGLGQVVLALFAALPLGGSSVHCEDEVLAGLVASLLYCAKDILDSLLIACKVGSESALVADGRCKTLALKQRRKRVEHLCAPTKTFREALRAYRHDHEFLYVNSVRGMRAAVEDIHHRDRKYVRIHAAEESVQRDIQRCRSRSCARDGNSEDRIRTELALVLGAVGVYHCLIYRVDVGRVHADDSVADNGVDVVHCLGNALSAESGLVAVAQLKRLELAGGSSAGSCSAGNGAVCEPYLGLNGRISAGIDYLAPDDILDL